MRACLVVFLAVLAGCGGGGGGADAEDVEVVATIAFPPASSVLEAPSIQVVGTTDNPSAVAALEVNGVAAVSTDGFATWRALVPLDAGPNTLRVELLESDGDVQVAAATTSVSVVEHVLPNLREIARAPTGEYFVFDRAKSAIYRLDPTTAATLLVSGAGRGSGEALPASPDDLVVDAPRNRLLLLDTNRILAIDLASGNRTIFADDVVGTGPLLRGASGMDIEPAAGRLVVANRGGADFLLLIDLATQVRTEVPDGGGPMLNLIEDVAAQDGDDLGYVAVTTPSGVAILSVDLVTGVRATVSEAGVRGIGPALDEPGSLVWDDVSQALLLIEPRLDACFAVAPGTGNRFLISGPTSGAGEETPALRDLELGRNTTEVVVCDDGVDAVLAIDTGSGDRSPIYAYERGGGPALYRPECLDFDASTNQVYVLDSGADRLFRIDLASGNRVLVTDGTRGPAAPWSQPVGLDLDLGADVAYVIDKSENALYAVDLLSGSRTVVSSFDLGVGTGPDLAIPHSVSLDLARGLCYLSDSSSQTGGVWSVDLSTGDRTKLADNTLGAGSPFRFAEGGVFDASRDVFFVSDQGEDAILAVDVGTGNRTILSNEDAFGSGPVMPNPHDVDLDPARGRALVPDDSADVLFGVDLTSGDRTIVSGSGAGLGPDLQIPEHAVPGPNGSILLVDIGLGALVLIEPTTGARAIISR